MAGHSAIVDKSGRMWIFGGSTGSGLLYDIYHINLADAKCEPGNSGKWTKVSTKNPPAARSSHSAVYHGGRMWVFGGWLGGDAPYSNEHTLSADVHYLDLEASTWSVVEPHGWKPMARYAHQALMGADGRMWIYGGYNINGTAKEGVAMVALDRLYCFDTDKRIWSALTAAGSAPNYLGYPFVAMDAAGRMWMGGGFISSTEVNANLFYLDTLSTDLQWKEVEDFKSDVDGPPLNRIGAEAVMEANGNMWIVGGMTELRQQLPLCRLATAVQAPTTATTTTTPRPDPGTYIWIILLVVLLCIIILGGAAVSPQEAQPETLAGKAGSAASGDG
ncbi:Leucine-zipper-like transcriptional regulator 1 (LZTR-1) [Durusdinium trenchii]|uniref:Leucine-zipper-like transcriptional regulator 1 (LZTR-1) n=1 Tax=Durusdinium trenchii TaxID=1381693 RepID=A0ABP0R385_9DINO